MDTSLTVSINSVNDGAVMTVAVDGTNDTDCAPSASPFVPPPAATTDAAGVLDVVGVVVDDVPVSAVVVVAVATTAPVPVHDRTISIK